MNAKEEWARRVGVLRRMDISELADLWDAGGFPPTNDQELLYAGAHKARLAVAELSEEEKEVSRRWLTSHDFSHSIGRA